MEPVRVTLSSTAPLVATPRDVAARDALRQRLALVFLSTYAVLLLAAGLTQIADPFIHYDDYPALVLYPEGYYMKTLAEGRWFNYWWHLRGFATPPAVNFQLYLVGWSLFIAAVAVNVFRSADLRIPALLAAFCVTAPQTTLIAGWFNTLIPGVWLIAAYAVIALFVSPRTGRWLLFVFVPVSIQAYTPYPFLLLAICLLREDQARSLRAFLATMTVFVSAFALGILIIYAINYHVHGVFGLALADWRDPNPATDLPGLIANLPKVAESLRWTYVMTGFGKPAFSLAIAVAFLASLALIARTRPIEALYLMTPLLAGLSLLSLHALMEGILFPFRSTYFLWFMVAITIVKGVHRLEARSGVMRSAPFALVLLLVLAAGAFARTHGQTQGAWQLQTRALADRIGATGTIYIYGSYIATNGYEDSRAQMPRDLQYRLAYLTGAWAEMCTEEPEACADVAPPFDPPETGDPLIVRDIGTDSFIRLPITEPAG